MFDRLDEQCGFEIVIPTPFMSFPRPLCHSSVLYVIPAPFMSFPRPLCHSRALYVIPAPFMSFPRPLCHSRALYVIPAPFMSFPRPLCHSRAGGNPVQARGFRLKAGMTRRGGCGHFIESADGPPVADYSKFSKRRYSPAKKKAELNKPGLESANCDTVANYSSCVLIRQRIST